MGNQNQIAACFFSLAALLNFACGSWAEVGSYSETRSVDPVLIRADPNQGWIFGCNVNCTVCSARRGGVLIWQGSDFGRRILAPTQSGDEIFIDADGKLFPRPQLFTTPVLPDDVRRLDRASNSIVVLEGGQSIKRIATGGVSAAFTRLSDLTHDGSEEQNACPDSGGRIDEGFRRAGAATRQWGSVLFRPHVNSPVTKPQVEFAIRGQRIGG